MYSTGRSRLNRFLQDSREQLLSSGLVGLEKENLRVGSDGHITQTSHPAGLGSALTHPSITTDYSEALLECITPPFGDVQDALNCLRDIHCFVYENLEDELLWAASMPCVVSGDASIPLARYGDSNSGTMKTVYRRGLGYRYGRTMQVIAGGHFNYSFSDYFWIAYQQYEQDDSLPRDFISNSYFCLIRNLQRFGWLVPYLFGASPAVCKSFLAGQKTPLKEFDSNTYYGPYATSLRMSDIGYQNTGADEPAIDVNYDNLEQYIASLTRAIETEHPRYKKIGVVVDGKYRQLNANILQIENEYYSSVRPKQILNPNEKPVVALRERGVQYVELRSLDINVLEPVGMSVDQLRFLEVLMIFCLFQESPPISEREHEEINWNLQTVALRGREPGLKLRQDGGSRRLKGWAIELCEELDAVAEALDQGTGQNVYSDSLQNQMDAIRDPGMTLSGRILDAMESKKEGFFHFAKRLSEQHKKTFSACQLNSQQRRSFEDAVTASVRMQEQIEAEDDCSFEEFLERYFSQP